MNIKRFFGKSSKEALSMVRKTLGDNAVILSNRTINGGNEIMAFREEDIDALIHENGTPSHEASFKNVHESDFVPNSAFEEDPAQEAKVQPYVFVKPDNLAIQTAAPQKTTAPIKTTAVEKNLPPAFEPVSKEFSKSHNMGMQTAEASIEPQQSQQIAAMLKEMRAMRNEMASQLKEAREVGLQAQQHLNLNTAQKTPVMPAKNEVQKPVPQQQMQDMMNEMRSMRNVFESKLTSLTWNNIQQQNPIKSGVLSMLLNAGFSASLSRQLAEKLPETLNGQKIDGERAKTWVKNILALNLKTIRTEEEMFDQGGIFALIGPTGVGKTTTTAKLAARYVMRHGTQNLGIITTDAYRIGGHEQLRIYGKILGVMVHAVKDASDLKIALNELKNKHTILIDTVGVSQHDRMVAEQIAMLSSTNHPIKKLLCLNATNTGETLTDVIRAYQGKGLDGCIMTKIDEAATIGNALDVMIRSKLPLYYATNGQRVPEDILLANKQALIEQAFKRNTATQWPYQFLDEELPFVMGNSIEQQMIPAKELNHA